MLQISCSKKCTKKPVFRPFLAPLSIKVPGRSSQNERILPVTDSFFVSYGRGVPPLQPPPTTTCP